MKIATRLVLIVLALLAIHLSLFTHSVYAVDPPNPQPCENAKETTNLTDIYIPNDVGGAPIIIHKNNNIVAAQGQVTLSGQASLQEDVDFSKLQALFASTNSNFLEGAFQNQEHRQANIIGLNSQDFNTYHAAGQKTAPKIIADDLKVKYINYVYNNPTLIESTNTYTDINNLGVPKTIYDLVGEFGLPQVPTSTASEEEKALWLATWGKYWEKIPTAYREFYKGKFEFRIDKNAIHSKTIAEGTDCPDTIRQIEFSMPEFSRTVSVSNQLNMTVVPCSAQSYRHGENDDQCANVAPTSQNILGKVVKTCLEAITNSTEKFSNAFKKAVKISLEIANPIKTVFAQPFEEPQQIIDTSNSCIKILGKDDKEGVAPYCAISQNQLIPGDFCTNPYGNDPNKLNTSQNVLCRFIVNWSATYTARIENDINLKTKDDFDVCRDIGGGNLSCDVTIKIWPVVRVPYLSEIWNNTLYSDEKEGNLNSGLGSPQNTGRPGIYSYFIPQSAGEEVLPQTYKVLSSRCYGQKDQSACAQIQQEVAACIALATTEEQAACLKSFWSSDLPAKTPLAGDSDLKQRFLGGVDCAKNFVKDIALKPKAVQEILGTSLSEDCS